LEAVIAAESKNGGRSNVQPSPAAIYVLLALADGRKHGYGIIKYVGNSTKSKLTLSSGTLYSLLARLRTKGVIEEVDVPVDKLQDDRRRYYRLTESGRLLLDEEVERLGEILRLASAPSKIDTR
jgi:DNA-binding PadR family transcriptional regulator